MEVVFLRASSGDEQYASWNEPYHYFQSWYKNYEDKLSKFVGRKLFLPILCYFVCLFGFQKRWDENIRMNVSGGGNATSFITSILYSIQYFCYIYTCSTIDFVHSYQKYSLFLRLNDFIPRRVLCLDECRFFIVWDSTIKILSPYLVSKNWKRRNDDCTCIHDSDHRMELFMQVGTPLDRAMKNDQAMMDHGLKIPSSSVSDCY